VLEAVCAEPRRESSTAYCESVGHIILDAESLNEQRGYQGNRIWLSQSVVRDRLLAMEAIDGL
jgi:hypothetical protein